MADLEQTLGDDQFDPDRSERNFRIAATDDAIEIIVGPMIERLRAAAPRAQFDIVSISEDVEQDLAAGKIDVAIGAEWWLRRVRQPIGLFTDRYVALSSTRRRMSLPAYAKAKHVLVAPHGRRLGTVDAELRKLGLSRRVTVTDPDFASAARLVATGSMIATIPGRIAAHYAERYSVHLFDPPLPLPSLQMSLAAEWSRGGVFVALLPRAFPKPSPLGASGPHGGHVDNHAAQPASVRGVGKVDPAGLKRSE